MNIHEENRYIENIKKQTNILENKLIDSLEEKLNMKGSIPGNMKSEINKKLLQQIKDLNETKDDSIVKKMMEEDLINNDLAKKYGLNDIPNHVQISLLDAAYHVYSTKRKMGSGRIISFIIALIFLHINLIRFVAFGNIDKQKLQEDMDAIFSEPLYQTIIALIKSSIATILSHYSITFSFVYWTLWTIQIVRFLFRLIKNNPFQYKLPVQENINQKEQHTHATYLYYKKLKLI